MFAGLARLFLPMLLLACVIAAATAQSPAPPNPPPLPTKPVQIGPTVPEPSPTPVFKEIKCGTGDRARRGSVQAMWPVEFGSTPTTPEETPKLPPNVVVPVPHTDGIRITYRGTSCDGCTWLQIVWRERSVIRDGAPNIIYGPATTIRTPDGGSYGYTDNVKEPHYHVDAPPHGAPAFPGVSRESNSVSLSDEPTTAIGKPHYTPAEEKLITSDIEIAHYDAYLVCDGVVCQHVSWTKTWGWRPGQPDPGTPKNPGQYHVVSVDDEKPDDKMIEKLNGDYPGQQLIK